MKIVLAGTRSFGAEILRKLLSIQHEIVLVAAPLEDKLSAAAARRNLPLVHRLTAETMVEADLIVAAHSHDFIGRKTRGMARFGGIGYHPSLLPLHRGRSAVEWTVRDRDRVAGGTVYWLDDRVDGGPIAAQDWCLVNPAWSASDLWREELFPMGLRLLPRVVDDIERGHLIQVPQDEACATFEPAMDPPPLARPDLVQLGDGSPWSHTVRTDREALRS